MNATDLVVGRRHRELVEPFFVMVHSKPVPKVDEPIECEKGFRVLLIYKLIFPISSVSRNPGQNGMPAFSSNSPFCFRGVAM